MPLTKHFRNKNINKYIIKGTHYCALLCAVSVTPTKHFQCFASNTFDLSNTNKTA